MMTYPLTVCNGYLVVEADGEKYVIDTGMNLSLSAARSKDRVKKGAFPMVWYPEFSPMLGEQIEIAIGDEIAGMIGFDMIKRQGGVECDLIKGITTFGAPAVREGVTVRFSRRDDLLFPIRVNGKQTIGRLDVGAPKPMVDDHSLLDLSRPEGQVTEPSAMGPILTEQYGGILEFGGVKREVHMLRSVRDMARDGSPIYFSVLPFAKEYFAINLAKQEIRFR